MDKFFKHPVPRIALRSCKRVGVPTSCFERIISTLIIITGHLLSIHVSSLIYLFILIFFFWIWIFLIYQRTQRAFRVLSRARFSGTIKHQRTNVQRPNTLTFSDWYQLSSCSRCSCRYTSTPSDNLIFMPFQWRVRVRKSRTSFKTAYRAC